MEKGKVSKQEIAVAFVIGNNFKVPAEVIFQQLIEKGASPEDVMEVAIEEMKRIGGK